MSGCKCTERFILALRLNLYFLIYLKYELGQSWIVLLISVEPTSFFYNTEGTWIHPRSVATFSLKISFSEDENNI